MYILQKAPFHSRRENPLQVLHRLSIMAQIVLESSTLRNFSIFSFRRLSSSPSLHLSIPGTSLIGSSTLTLADEKNWWWANPVISCRYLRFEQVVDLGSEDTSLTRTRYEFWLLVSVWIFIRILVSVSGYRWNTVSWSKVRTSPLLIISYQSKIKGIWQKIENYQTVVCPARFRTV